MTLLCFFKLVQPFVFLAGKSYNNRPTAQAVVALTFAYYVLQPGFQTCDPPDIAVRLLAAICISEL
jgi:hypothetical protein